jgi:hypothetical protein
MIYTLKDNEPRPSTVGFQQQYQTLNGPQPGKLRPVSFSLNPNGPFPYWRERSLDERPNLDVMYLPKDSNFGYHGVEPSTVLYTYVQVPAKTNLTPCPVSSSSYRTILLPGKINWHAYRDEDYISIRRYSTKGLFGEQQELWTRRGIVINQSKTWRQNNISVKVFSKNIYGVFPVFTPIACWQKSFATTFSIYEYGTRIRFCGGCQANTNPCNDLLPDLYKQCCTKCNDSWV